MYYLIPSNIPAKLQYYLKIIHIRLQAAYSTAIISILGILTRKYASSTLFIQDGKILQELDQQVPWISCRKRCRNQEKILKLKVKMIIGNLQAGYHNG